MRTYIEETQGSRQGFPDGAFTHRVVMLKNEAKRKGIYFMPGSIAGP